MLRLIRSLLRTQRGQRRSGRCYFGQYRAAAKKWLSAGLLGSVVLLGLSLSAVNAASIECDVSGHWRDVAYETEPMKKYEPLKKCIAWTAYQFDLPEELLYSILYVERGPLNGRCGTNRNGTQDCGPAQINDVRLSELKQFGLSKKDIRQKPCHNIWAMGYLVRREIEKADGNIWRGVGNYHYHYSASQKLHDRYVNRIRNAWNTLVSSTFDYCLEEDATAARAEANAALQASLGQ